LGLKGIVCPLADRRVKWQIRILVKIGGKKRGGQVPEKDITNEVQKID
jgi:hypothetical protein